MLRNKINFSVGLTCVAFFALITQGVARPNVDAGQKPSLKKGLLKTTAGCDPATASIDLDINNIRAKMMTGGDMWWDIGIGEARYEVPKGSKKNSLFAGSVWIGGFTPDKQLKVAAQSYRQNGNDYWPGPLNSPEGTSSAPTIDKPICADWDRFWKIDRSTLTRFRELQKISYESVQSAEFEHILSWPARGNGSNSGNSNLREWRAKGTSGELLYMQADRQYAPFVDVDGDGYYNPEKEDYPDIFGDQYIWWVFNDMGNTKNETQSEAIGIEVQASAFAFATKDYLNDATFYNYKLLNRSTNQLDSTFIATWTDADLGYYKDDFIGCDTFRGLGIIYNGNPVDGSGDVTHYGSNIPMLGIDFFKGPKRAINIAGKDTFEVLKMEAFTYFDNNNDPRIGNPSNGVQVYNYMTGSLRNGQRFVNDFQSAGVQAKGLTQGPITKVVFPGDPEKSNEWSECVCQNPVDDRRFIHSSGPFILKPGAENDVTIGAVWVPSVGGCPNVSFKRVRAADDMAQTLFDNGFKTIEGPEAPRLIVREMDKKLIFYIANDPISTNYQEKFGYQVDSAKYRVASAKAKKYSADSLYKFEGYRVFQLKNAQVQPSQIFDENGVVNSELAREVFQADISNGVSQLVNWEKNIDIVGCDNCWDATIKVNGKDSGIVHSFELTVDAFSTEAFNRAFVNYRTYYFTAIAYATNNFAKFEITKHEETQDITYLESVHGPGGTSIPVVAAMPNPFSGQVGTYAPAQYGDGVVIKKLEGIGNGGNFLQLDGPSEAEALSATSGYIAKQPTYLMGQGPINVKVVDPYKIPAANWSLYIRADSSKSAPYTINNPSQGDVGPRLRPEKARWFLINEEDNQVIYSERNLSVLNEQIIEKYGLSVSIKQEVRPGDNREGGNGYIESDIIYTDVAQAWLGGVPDIEGQNPQNWIRSGGNETTPTPAPQCDYRDNAFDPGEFYEGLLDNNRFTKSTWTAYAMGAVDTASREDLPTAVRGLCGFGTVRIGSQAKDLYDLQGVDVVFTSDKSKWSRCVVLEMNDDRTLSEGNAPKFRLRKHRSWDKEVDANGNPVYLSDANDMSRSWFPGYAVNQETGERLEIVFSEDSYLKNHNGGDMIWNPTTTVLDNANNPIFGGRHYIYVSKFRYDGGDTLRKLISSTTETLVNRAFSSFLWTGLPVVNEGFRLLSLKDGLIPTETRLRFRVTRPYGQYVAPGVDTTVNGSNRGYPWYTFSTHGLAPRQLSDAGNPNDKQSLLDRIHAVPNPYYAYAGYEANRFDTRVRIINLPKRATISVYSLDGSLIRRLEKDNDVAYYDWDIRNAKGLPIASGMYLIHINAEGLGETILRWFGAMRPVDIVNY